MSKHTFQAQFPCNRSRHFKCSQANVPSISHADPVAYPCQNPQKPSIFVAYLSLSAVKFGTPEEAGEEEDAEEDGEDKDDKEEEEDDEDKDEDEDDDDDYDDYDYDYSYDCEYKYEEEEEEEG